MPQFGEIVFHTSCTISRTNGRFNPGTILNLPQKIAAEVVVKTHANTLSHPITNAMNARDFGGDTIKAKWYWPPVEGYAEASSAIPAAIQQISYSSHITLREYSLMQEHAKAATISPQKTVGPPPSNKGVMKLAEYPIQEFVIENATANIANAENCLGSSPLCPWARNWISSAESVSADSVCEISLWELFDPWGSAIVEDGAGFETKCRKDDDPTDMTLTKGCEDIKGALWYLCITRSYQVERRIAVPRTVVEIIVQGCR